VKNALIGTAVAGALALTGCGDSGEAAEPTSPTTSAPGASVIDVPFGSVGVSPVALSEAGKDRFSATALGADGAQYAAGLTTDGKDQRLAVARFTAAGAFDPAFGTAGIASLNASVGTAGEQARSIVVQPDGKVVVAGTAEHDASAAGPAAKDTDVVLARFDATGTPDATFGTGGLARIDLGAGKAVDEETFVGDTGYGLTLLPSGGFAVFAQTSAGADREDSDFALVGLTPTGALDPAFGTKGVTKVDVGGDSARNVTVDGDHLLATGYSHGADEVVSPVLVRTSLKGVLDASFGKAGVATHKILGAVTESYSVQPQGEAYVLAGYGKQTEDEKVDLVAYRFTAEGEWDKTFGTNGLTRIDNAGQDDRARNLKVLADGRVLLVGSGKVDADNAQAMVVLLGKDGLPDAGFGAGGRILTDLGGVGDSWYGVAVSADGRTASLAGFRGVDPESTTDDDDAVVGRVKLAP
jgi:uncharacterized delta-60 repeat protein